MILFTNDEYDEFLDELENAADEVFDYIDTNNHALSTALTQKSMICRQKDIPFNAMADGEGIDFMLILTYIHFLQISLTMP